MLEACRKNPPECFEMPDDLETPTTPDHPDDDDRAGPWVKTADGQVIRLPAETRFAIEDLLDNRIEKGSDKNKQARAALADALRQERVTPGFLPLGILVRLENMFDPRMRDSVPAWLNIVPTSEPREDRDQRN